MRVAAVGSCHTDLIIRDQWYPVPLPCVLGHEGTGVVEAVGSAVTKVQPGDHVGMSYHSCGACANCVGSRPMNGLAFLPHNFVGAPPMSTDVALDMNAILVGRTVRGTVEGDSIPQLFIPALLELHGQGRFQFDRLIEVYDFEQIDEAARDSEEGRVLKPDLRI